MQTVDLSLLNTLSKNTDEILWSSYNCSLSGSFANLNSKLIFPKYQNRSTNQLRVSEQEARFAFVSALKNTQFLYAIETPTFKKYTQKGTKDSTASFDLSLFNSLGNPYLNVEFKAGGISTKAKSTFKIRKDIEKLLKDPGNGMWFHLLEAVDNQTILKLFSTLNQDLIQIIYELKRNEKQMKQLIFHICVLRHRFSLHKAIMIDNSKSINSTIKDFFQINYEVTRTKLKRIIENNGWDFYQLQD